MKILVLPGMDGTGKLLGDFVKQLEVTHETTAINYPNDTSLSYTELCDLVRQDCPKNEDYILIAESFSGPIATYIARKAALNLKAVILVASFIQRPIQLPSFSYKILDKLPIFSPKMIRLARPFTFGKCGSAAHQAQLLKAIQHVSKDVMLSRIRQIMHVDVRDEFSNIKIPLLYIRPQSDKLVRPKMADIMKKLNPNLTIVDVEGPHFILQTHPEKCAYFVKRFLRDLNAP